MVQNHLLQILCLIAMEPPVSFDADEIRNKKVDVLHADPADPPGRRSTTFAVRGQYGAGWIAGEHVPAYREEAGVAPDSTTETFAAVKLFVDNWRWQDVPFYLRTGKRLPARISEVSIQFQPVPHQSFPADGDPGLAAQPPGDPHPARRRDPAAASRPSSPGRTMHLSTGGDAFQLPGGLPQSARRRPTRRCCWT